MSSRQLPEKFLVAFSFAGEQRQLVRAVAEAVEAELGPGTVFLDEWFEYYVAGADADLKLQEIYGSTSELVVPCVSERYGGKPWTQTEHEAIRARLMQARSSATQRDRDRILPIRVGDGDVPGIPFNTIAPDIREKSIAEAARLITDRLRLVLPGLGQAPAGAPADAWLAEPPSSLTWPMVDHSGAREAFAALLTGGAQTRLLRIRGVSETGKSRITKQMLADVLQIPDLACGRFDFKGGTDMDVEVRVFVQELGVALPPPSSLLNERLAHVLIELADRKRPTLLIFDTYEDAAKPQQDWVEKELLQRLVRAPWLRVVVAGQRVPEGIGAPLSRAAGPPIDLAPPQPADWFDFGKQHRPDLSLEFVEQACVFAEHRAGLLAQLFGPRRAT